MARAIRVDCFDNVKCIAFLCASGNKIWDTERANHRGHRASLLAYRIEIMRENWNYSCQMFGQSVCRIYRLTACDAQISLDKGKQVIISFYIFDCLIDCGLLT